MNPPPVPVYPGKRYVALATQSGPRVEVYRGATVEGALRPRGDLVSLRMTTGFAWGALCDGTAVLAASILAHAFGGDDERAARLAPLFAAEVIANRCAFASWVMTYESIQSWVASAEDDLERAESEGL